MATSTLKYITVSELHQLGNARIGDFDSKFQIFNWEIDDNLGYAYNTGNVSMLFSNGAKLGTAESTSGAVDSVGEWFYDSDADKIWYYFGSSNTNPNDKTMEGGIDFNTFVTDQIESATQQLNSMLDNSKFTIPIPKAFQYSQDPDNDTPEYDFIIKKLTALITTYNLMTYYSPTSEDAESIWNQITNSDGMGLLDKLNGGLISLNYETNTADSSGNIIEVTGAGTMKMVETYSPNGWTGEPFDRVQCICTTAGIYGTAEISVKTISGVKLYGNELSGVVVSGGLQHLMNGLWVRYEGNSLSENDRFDVEVRRGDLKTTDGSVRSVQITRS